MKPRTTRKKDATKGRPRFEVTAARRLKVEQLAACGMMQADIARAIGCHVDTLRDGFAEQLLTGRAKKRAEVLGQLFKSAKGGNVSAQKYLEQLTGAVADPPPPQHAAVEKPEKLGKKEQAQIEAERPPEDGKSRWSGLLN